MSSVKVDLEQILEVALSSQEAGNVNFNVLRGFLCEILKHLGIKRKTIWINDESDDFKTVYEMIQDGILEARGQSPFDLDMIQERASPVLQHETASVQQETASVQQETASEDKLPNRSPSSKRSKSATPRMSRERSASAENKSDTSIASPDPTSKNSPVFNITPPPTSSFLTSGGSITNAGASVHKTSSRSSQSFAENTGVRGEVRTIKKTLVDLQLRVEHLENPRTPMKVKSTASMFFQSESKTPAQDMLEVINIGRKLEASESTIQALSEMIDALTLEVNDVKDKLSKTQNIETVSTEMENFKDALKELENTLAAQTGKRQSPAKDPEELEEKELEEKQKDEDETREVERKKIVEYNAKQKEIERNVEHLNKEIKTLMAHISTYKHDAERKIQHEINQLATQFLSTKEDHDAAPFVISNEPPKECYEALDKCEELQEAHAVIEEQVKDVETRVETLEESINAQRASAPDSSSDFIHQLRLELETLNNKIDQATKETSQALKRLDFERQQVKTFLEENKRQVPQLQNSFNLQEKEVERINGILQALIAEKEDLKSQSIHRTRTHSITDGSEDISLIRSMIFDLQEEKDNLKHANKSILEQIYMKQKGLDELHEQLETIQDLKADKDLVTNEIKFKADKREVELKVEREDFDRYIGLVDQSLRDLLQRLEGHENVLREAMDSISGHIRTKLDKAEVEPLKLFLEERLKSFKPKPVEIRPPAEDYAAGFRKVLIKNFSCISCDRPVDFARDGMFPPLPSTQPMPIKKSNRPYTTYELDQVRQHMIRGGLEIDQERFEAIDNRRRRLQSELLKLSGTPNIEQLAEVIDRPCGGSHTLSFPHSRSIVRGLQLNKDELILETSDKSLQNVDIMGQDGHIYKGLVEDVPGVVLPQIGDKPIPSPPPTVKNVLDEDTGRNHSTTPTCEKPLPTDSNDDDDSS